PRSCQRVARHADRRNRGRAANGGGALMLYFLLYESHRINLIQYVTFRTAAASLTAFALSVLLGPWLIGRLRAFQVGQVIRTDGPATRKPRAGPPRVCGLLFLHC